MKNEWEFDDDDEEEDFGWKDSVSTSKKSSATSSNKDSPAASSISSSSRSKSSSSSKGSIAAAVARGRQQISIASSVSSSMVSSSQPSSRTSEKPTLLRTRAARLKAKGVKPSPNRKVRFQLSCDDTSSSSVPLVASSYRSLAESHTIRNKQRRRKRQLDLKDDDFSGEKKGVIKPKTPSVSLHTTNVDAYAVQDIAKVQRLTDELRYCCDNLHSSRKVPRQLEAIVDLSQMLSDRKTRQCLFFTHHLQGNDGEELTPLASVLQMMKWVYDKMVVVSNTSDNQNGAPRTRNGQRAKTESSSVGQEAEGLSSSVVEALGILWHFLSTDCTMASDSSAQTSSATRNLRESILSNQHAMQGLLEIIVSDPYLEPILGKEVENEESVASMSPFKIDIFSQESSTSTLSSSLPASPESFASADPTVAGRWRKRRRKMMQAGQSLGQIKETESLKDEKSSLRDGWSYTSESPSRGPLDDGSLSSSSNVADTQVQLGKLLEKVKETVEFAESVTHGCGSDKNEVLARLPLLSLCRIVRGKYEGEDKSCIDDELGMAPSDDDEDEMSRNPLLRTNATIAEKGLIPFLARATSKAALAIVEQLTNREPCTGCENYMKWKFCTLSAVVDDSCLLTDANREALATEGFAPETGGCLLVNLATTLMVLLEKGKLFDDNGWGEVAMVALRSLTSLTHDNKIAARDLEAITIKSNGMRSRKCLTVIVEVLYEASTHDGDMANYCLNTLANVMDSGASWEPLAKLKVGDEEEPFLQWLTKHIVAETVSFQDAVVESSFGSSQDRHSERQLDKHEYEALMMAGNAFIFLSCILVRESAKASNKVNEEILAHLPGNGRESKLLFVKNTLKAFCNLCHFSMGALSLAIVAPVKKLLSDLEAI